MQPDASQNPRYKKDRDYSIDRRSLLQTILILDPKTAYERCLLSEMEILENKKKNTKRKRCTK